MISDIDALRILRDGTHPIVFACEITPKEFNWALQSVGGVLRIATEFINVGPWTYHGGMSHTSIAIGANTKLYGAPPTSGNVIRFLSGAEDLPDWINDLQPSDFDGADIQLRWGLRGYDYSAMRVANTGIVSDARKDRTGIVMEFTMLQKTDRLDVETWVIKAIGNCTISAAFTVGAVGRVPIDAGGMGLKAGSNWNYKPSTDTPVKWRTYHVNGKHVFINVSGWCNLVVAHDAAWNVTEVVTVDGTFAEQGISGTVDVHGTTLLKAAQCLEHAVSEVDDYYKPFDGFSWSDFEGDDELNQTVNYQCGYYFMAEDGKTWLSAMKDIIGGAGASWAPTRDDKIRLINYYGPALGYDFEVTLYKNDYVRMDQELFSHENVTVNGVLYASVTDDGKEEKTAVYGAARGTVIQSAISNASHLQMLADRVYNKTIEAYSFYGCRIGLMLGPGWPVTIGEAMGNLYKGQRLRVLTAPTSANEPLVLVP